ncbi:unannotated protein [freshwater metagenome]|uniref:Unannotated protein n=1 Tax=freshwater metagenome TaxID=449393 RepID=A0A6J5Z4A6_9ZZZZ|nr:hypothetical protein [Actinomycetota bacterium]
MRSVRTLAILALPLMLTGCLRIEGEIKAGADAKVTGVLEYGISKSLSQISGETWTLEKLQNSDEAKDAKSICANGIWSENSQEFVMTCNFSSSQVSDPDLYVKIVDNKIEFHYSQNLDSDEESLELGNVTMKVGFPGEIITIRENKPGTVLKSSNNQITLKAAGTAKIDVTVTSSCGTTCGVATTLGDVGTNGKPYVNAPKTAGGLISENLRFTKANSPYTLTSTLQIPKEFSVIVDAGVEIIYNGPRYGAKSGISQDQEGMFYVHGNIDFKGTDSNQIKLSGEPRYYFLVEGSKDNANILINDVIFQGGYGLVYGSASYAYFSLKNSIISDVPAYQYIWYPTKPLIIEGNIFKNSGGMSIGFDGRSSSKKPNTPQVTVRDNLFIGPSTTDYWVENWVAYGSTLFVTGNSFTEGPYTAVSVRKGYDNVSVNASGNYWGTTDQTKIASMVKDSKDGLDFQTVIKTDNPLTFSSLSNLIDKSVAYFTGYSATQAFKSAEDKLKAAQDKIAENAKKTKLSSTKVPAKEITIVCQKGKSQLKVIGVKPICPSGYKKTK